MRPARAIAILSFLVPGLFLASCAPEESGLVATGLSEAGLVGEYRLAKYKLSYRNSTTVDYFGPKLSGSLGLSSDSGYVRTLSLRGESEDKLMGKITSVRVEGQGSGKGELVIFRSSQGGLDAVHAQFQFLGDTLLLSEDIPEDQDPEGIGYTEKGWWLKTSPSSRPARCGNP